MGNFRRFQCNLGMEERIGQPVRQRELVDLNNCMNTCKLVDVKATGQFHTWSNKQDGDRRVYCKLDGVMGNEAYIARRFLE